MTAQELRALLPGILQELPADARRAMAARLTWEVYERPRRLDLERGADAHLTADSPGYFYGHGLGDEGDEFEEDEGGGLAEPVDDAGGVIVLFAHNIADREQLAEVVGHEVAHFLGADEDELEELSGDVSEDDEIFEDDEEEV